MNSDLGTLAQDAFEFYMAKEFPGSIKGNRAWKIDRQTFFAGVDAGITLSHYYGSKLLRNEESYCQPKVVARSGNGKVDHPEQG